MVSQGGFAVGGDFRLGHDPRDHERSSERDRANGGGRWGDPRGWGGSVRDDHDLALDRLAHSGPYEDRWSPENRPDPRFVEEHAFGGPYVGRGPKGYVRSDARIHEEICEMLYLQGYVDTAEVEITVDKGEITLRGTVAARRDKRFVEEMIERVAGVNEIHNHLRRHRPEALPADAKGQSEATILGHPNRGAVAGTTAEPRVDIPTRSKQRPS